MVGKAPLAQALYTGATTESVLVLVAGRSDIAERRLGFVYRRTHGVEMLAETYQ